jgi:ribonuclease HII
MPVDLWAHEREARNSGFLRIAGVDEAGRGPLAGPVVAAAVVLPADFSVDGVNDSKKLTAGRRRRLFDAIYAQAAAVGIGIVDAVEIDRINILQASLLAMAMAVDNLQPAPDCLLVDGLFTIDRPLQQQALKKGDARSISIAAASIVAKETRDRLMHGYHQQYPQFGFDRHKGYPTQAHKAAIHTWGPTPIHRRSFKGV